MAALACTIQLLQITSPDGFTREETDAARDGRQRATVPRHTEAHEVIDGTFESGSGWDDDTGKAALQEFIEYWVRVVDEEVGQRTDLIPLKRLLKEADVEALGLGLVQVDLWPATWRLACDGVEKIIMLRGQDRNTVLL
ncbi:hypothetical protein N7533_011027 [Penicillium manginii]|uniref:uncharacterized protein n=1 Tax=Penicillium manginii TaxID=203109 RepID=UPI002547CB78|nr:uncharacterized protein N7533_011027 [Penicillium manginii]KAJ5741618.1 hypothetical protein N7533_011027 [Penicillium manginii]